MDFKDKLKLIRTDNNLTQDELAKKIKISRSNIANYENGQNMPSIEIINKLAEVLDCSIDYLLGRSEIKNSNKLNNINLPKKAYMCPVYGQISAGQPNWAEENIQSRIMLDLDLFNITNPEEYFFLKVNGDSMNLEIKDGAYALIHKQDFVENGEIAVVLVDSLEATLKKFRQQGDVILLEPMSSNPEHQIQIYNNTVQIKILGKYVGKMEINK